MRHKNNITVWSILWLTRECLTMLPRTQTVSLPYNLFANDTIRQYFRLSLEGILSRNKLTSICISNGCAFISEPLWCIYWKTKKRFALQLSSDYGQKWLGKVKRESFAEHWFSTKMWTWWTGVLHQISYFMLTSNLIRKFFVFNKTQNPNS